MFKLAKCVTLLVVVAVVLSACAPTATPTPQVITKVETKVVMVTPTPVPAAGPEPFGDEIKIGFDTSVTGAAAEMYQFQSRGVAVGQALRPTVLGKPVKLILVDDKSEKAEAAIVMNRLVEQEKVIGVIGMSWSSLSLVGNEVAEKAGVPVLATTMSNPLTIQGKKYIFTTVNPDDKAGPLQAGYLVNYLKMKTVVIVVNIQEDFPVGYANYFRQAFIQLTGDPKSVLAQLSYQTGDKDFSAQLETIKRLKPDAVFCPNYNEGDALLFRQARDMGLTETNHFQMQEGWTYENIPGLAGGAPNGSCCLSYYAPEGVNTELSKAYFKKFYELYPDAQPTFQDVIMFDDYNIMCDAIEHVGVFDRDAVRDYIANLENWPGASGVITFKGHGGSPPRAVPALCWENDKLVFKGMVEMPAGF